MNGIRVDPETRDLRTVGPGETRTVTVALRNTSDVVQHLAVQVVGLPRGCDHHAEPEVIKLLPATGAKTRISIRIGSQEETPAGDHVVGVLVSASHAENASCCEELRMRVAAAPAAVLRVDPRLVTGRGDAQLMATVHNTGNVRLPVLLSGSDAERKARVVFTPASLDLRPGETGASRLSVRVPRRWTGSDVSRDLVVRAESGRFGVEATARLVQRPLLSPVALRAAGRVVKTLVVLAVLVALGLLVALAVPFVDAVLDRLDAPAEPTAPPEPAQSP